MNLNDGSKLKLITVYFRCYDTGSAYINDLSNCLGFLESCIHAGENEIIGDMNFGCDDTNKGFKLCCDLLDPLHISNCDALCSSVDRVTYYNISLGQSSFTDHFFCV